VTISLWGILLLAKAVLSLTDKLLYLAFKFLAAGYNLFFKLVGLRVPED
jgi:hypothetical protein